MNIESQIEQRSRPVTNWAPIVGLWDFDNGRATYKAPQDGQQDGQQPSLFGMCVSDARFTEGEAWATLRQASGSVNGRLLLGYQSPTNDYYLVGLGGQRGYFAYTIMHFIPDIAWRVVAGAGAQQNLHPGRCYKIAVRIRGQRITLEIDGVRVLEHVLDAPLPSGQLGLFAWGEQGGAEFSDVSVREELGTAFVVMQLADGRFQELYEQVIREVAKEFGLVAVHAGDLPGPGLIIEDIASSIVASKIVIAEITVPNQNVFYELGYAHGKNKPTILLAEKGRELPFDVHGYRCLFYENSIGGKQKIEDGLRKHLQAIFRT
jgi:hypothetical protein